MAAEPVASSIPPVHKRVVSIQRQEHHSSCQFADGTKFLLTRILSPYVTIGDEIAFPIPSADAAGAEIYITKNCSSGKIVFSIRRQSDTSAVPSGTNETSTSFLPRFNAEASASARFSCLARSSASTSIACRVRPTASIIPLCTRSCVSRPALRPPSFAWLSSCVIWS